MADHVEHHRQSAPPPPCHLAASASWTATGERKGQVGGWTA